MKSKVFILAVALAAGFATGCNVGMTASGGSPEEVKSSFDKLPLETRAQSIMGSPAPMEQKKKMIKEMYEKEGKTPPEDLSSLSGRPNMGR